MNMLQRENIQPTNAAKGSVKPSVGREIREIEQRIADASHWVEPLKREIGRVIVGQQGLIEGLLIGLLTGGHVLLEGVPGLAKTLALKTLAGSIDGAQFSRIQFTPDMLPSDIVGTTIYLAHSASFEVKHGPIFANLVLADEINRAPAKVQSALLEAMQERQVTLGGESFGLPNPFLVLATQNPLEQEGTYPLPEAQIDRFMLKIVVNYPSLAEERAILDTMAVSTPMLDVSPVASLDAMLLARRIIDQVYVDDAVRDYVVRIVAQGGRILFPLNFWQSCLKQLEKVGVTPGRKFSFGLNAVFMGALVFRKIHRNLAELGDVFRPVVGSDSRLILIEGNVKTPMQLVLDGPVAANH